MKTLKLPTSGVELTLRRVSPLLMLELRRKFPEPKPPVNVVDYGDGHKVSEANVADPEYALTLQAYESDMELRLRRVVIQRGVVLELTDEQKTQVAELRAYWEAEGFGKLEGSDKEVFVNYIAVESQEDVEVLIEEILARSQPTEKETQVAINSFPGEVQGTGHLQNLSTP